MTKRRTAESINQQVFEQSEGCITLDASTYVNVDTKARFIDKDYSTFEWWITPNNIMSKKCSHPKRKLAKKIQTSLKNWGVPFPAQNPEVQEKQELTNLSKYGVKSSFQNSIVQETYRKNYFINSGYENPMQNPEVQERTAQTNILKYGSKNPMQNHTVAMKAAMSVRNSENIRNWSTGKEDVCVASYEIATVKYLNSKQINFEWQPKTFEIPLEIPLVGGKTYRPDGYIKDWDLWIEVKGYMRKDAQEKWDWFHQTYPNSELWDKAKLKELGIL